MKLTEKRLKEIIKEEIARMQEGPGLGGKLGKTLTRQAVQRKTLKKSEKTSARRAEMDAEKERAAALDIAVSTKSSDGFPVQVQDSEGNFRSIGAQTWMYELPDHIELAIGRRRPISLADLEIVHATAPDGLIGNVDWMNPEPKDFKSMLQALIAKYSQGEE
jgi:hypothetical protein